MCSVVCFDNSEEVEVMPTQWDAAGAAARGEAAAAARDAAVFAARDAAAAAAARDAAAAAAARDAAAAAARDAAAAAARDAAAAAGDTQPRRETCLGGSLGDLRLGQRVEECGIPPPLLRDLLVNQQILMDQQKSMIRMIQDLHRPIQGGQRMSTTSPPFPLRDKLALEALEGDLASQRDLRQELGELMPRTVWRILKQAIKNDLAKNTSWRGMNGKISFEKLLLKAVVMDAVRRNPSCSTATDVQIADAIKRWFYWAGDREAGRKKRQPAPNQEQTD
ncbi:unnamed protein product [Arctogadus glacialis]